ncbi:hypothetical protein ACWGRF_38245, partial [Streptomyces zhihengii]
PGDPARTSPPRPTARPHAAPADDPVTRPHPAPADHPAPPPRPRPAHHPAPTPGPADPGPAASLASVPTDSGPAASLASVVPTDPGRATSIASVPTDSGPAASGPAAPLPYAAPPGVRVLRPGDVPAQPPEGELPRRIRQSHLVPQLRDVTNPAPPRTAAPPGGAAGRSPEAVRDRMAAYRDGWVRGGGTPPGTPAAPPRPTPPPPAPPRPTPPPPARPS